ncbi:hypothetical protein M877_19400 [Streptomyces niveus NCIMB 11891]|nr:hypothetical protein M877_19400 [Streptomyces niveus NCIMB 11891]
MILFFLGLAELFDSFDQLRPNPAVVALRHGPR